MWCEYDFFCCCVPLFGFGFGFVVVFVLLNMYLTMDVCYIGRRRRLYLYLPGPVIVYSPIITVFVFCCDPRHPSITMEERRRCGLSCWGRRGSINSEIVIPGRSDLLQKLNSGSFRLQYSNIFWRKMTSKPYQSRRCITNKFHQYLLRDFVTETVVEVHVSCISNRYPFQWIVAYFVEQE